MDLSLYHVGLVSDPRAASVIMSGRNREIYLKLRLGTESFRSNVVKLGPNPKWLEATEMFIPDVSNCPELELKLKDSKAKELGR